MSGGAIVITTVLCIGIAAWLIVKSFEVLAEMNEFYNNTDSKYKFWTKVLLFIPYVFLTIFCAIMGALLLGGAVWGAYSTARNTRDWWNRSHRK